LLTSTTRPIPARLPRTSCSKRSRRLRDDAESIRLRPATLAEYLKVNPKGRVPALVTDRGILTETPAMLASWRRGFPKANLR